MVRSRCRVAAIPGVHLAHFQLELPVIRPLIQAYEFLDIFSSIFPLAADGDAHGSF
jgi:hypothetical protein